MIFPPPRRQTTARGRPARCIDAPLGVPARHHRADAARRPRMHDHRPRTPATRRDCRLAGVGGGDGDGERSRNCSAKLPPGVLSSPLPPLLSAPSGCGGGDGGGGSTRHGDVLLSMQAATSTAPPLPPALAGAGGGDGGGERSLNGSAQLPLGAPSSPLPPLVGVTPGHGGGDGGGGSTDQCGLPALPPNPRQELEGIPQSTPILSSDTTMRLVLTFGEGHFLIEDLVRKAHLIRRRQA